MILDLFCFIATRCSSIVNVLMDVLSLITGLTLDEVMSSIISQAFQHAHDFWVYVLCEKRDKISSEKRAFATIIKVGEEEIVTLADR